MLAVLATLAFGGARALFADRVGVPDVTVEVERGLRPIIRRQVVLEGAVVEEPVVAGTRTPDLPRWLDSYSDIDARIARARSRSAPGPRPALEVDWQAVQSGLPSVFDVEP